MRDLIGGDLHELLGAVVVGNASSGCAGRSKFRRDIGCCGIEGDMSDDVASDTASDRCVRRRMVRIGVVHHYVLSVVCLATWVASLG